VIKHGPSVGEHAPTDACLPVHCHWHNVDEPGTGYILCGECGHLYRTPRELRQAYRKAVLHMQGMAWWRRIFQAATVRAGRRSFCQFCVHDF
jgi:hypothetical protein